VYLPVKWRRPVKFAGAKVVLLDINIDLLKVRTESLRSDGLRFPVSRCDVLNKKISRKQRVRFGTDSERIDILNQCRRRQHAEGHHPGAEQNIFDLQIEHFKEVTI